MTRVLVVATSRKTRGGITSVIKTHETGEQWKRFHCHWVQTHRDGPTWRKLLYLGRSVGDFLIRIPFYDIVHLHISQPTTIRRKQPFLKIAKALGKKIIIHFHAFNVKDTIDGKYSEQYKSFFCQADKVIVLSNWWKEQFIRRGVVAQSKIDVLYNPCPEVCIDNSRKKKIILYAGTVNERKGYRDLIKAFAKIVNKYPDWTINIAGNGEINEGTALATELGISDNVKFLGWISGKDKEKAFQEASIFCLPSYAEGFPMAVLDAWAYGLPVITTPVGGIPDVAKDGENMLLFNPGDIEELTKQLNRMISNECLREQIAQHSFQLSKTTFNQDTINKQLELIYDSI